MRIVILNDGTTWTPLEGCVIATVPDDFEGDIGPLMRKALSDRPDTTPVYDGELGEDNDGQKILYTGLPKVEEAGDLKARGEFIA